MHCPPVCMVFSNTDWVKIGSGCSQQAAGTGEGSNPDGIEIESNISSLKDRNVGLTKQKKQMKRVETSTTKPTKQGNWTIGLQTSYNRARAVAQPSLSGLELEGQGVQSMSFQEDIGQLRDRIAEVMKPETKDLLDNFIKNMKESRVEFGPLRIGDTIPAFSLPNAVGKTVSSTDMLQRGPLVVVFYRGSWCPYCNLYLKTLRDWVVVFKRYGAQLLAISGMTPDNSMSFAEKLQLEFEVLSDKDLKVAQTFGLVYEPSETMKESFRASGLDFEQLYGNKSFRLPIPAVYVINRVGAVVYTFVDMDWRNRPDPGQVEDALRFSLSVDSAYSD